MRTAIAGCLLAAVLATPALGVAAPPGQTAPFPPFTLAPAAPPAVPDTDAGVAHRRVGYRLPLAAVDLASIAAIGTGVALGSDAMTGAGVISLFVAAPIAHAAFGNPGSSALSFAARGGLPVLGLLAGAGLGAMAHGSDEDGVATYILGGFFAGSATALVIDYGFLARRRAEPAGHTLAVTPTDGGALVGLGGAF
jgi:hypothetical protein